MTFQWVNECTVITSHCEGYHGYQIIIWHLNSQANNEVSFQEHQFHPVLIINTGNTRHHCCRCDRSIGGDWISGNTSALAIWIQWTQINSWEIYLPKISERVQSAIAHWSVMPNRGWTGYWLIVSEHWQFILSLYESRIGILILIKLRNKSCQ